MGQQAATCWRCSTQVTCYGTCYVTCCGCSTLLSRVARYAAFNLEGGINSGPTVGGIMPSNAARCITSQVEL